VVRLHLHRRPAGPVAEGQSPCPDEQIVAATTQGRADPAQPDHARLVSLLPACSGQTHHELPGKLRVAQGDSLVPETAPLEWTRHPPTPHRSSWPVDQTFGGRDRTVQPGLGTHHAVPLPGQHDPQPLDGGTPRLTVDAVESPLRGNTHGGFGERPGETDRWQHRHRAPGRLNQARVVSAVDLHLYRTPLLPGRHLPPVRPSADRVGLV
jgi:hypothetical protein